MAKYKIKADDDGKKTIRKPAKAEKKALRKKKIRRAVLIAVSVLLLICFGVGFAGFKLLDSLQPAVQTRPQSSTVNEEDLFFDNDVKNILLLGMDGRKSNGKGLSDVMTLISINRKTKTTTLVSFQRDTWVKIPGYGSAKLNASGSYGGAPLVIDTLESNFRIKIDFYVLVTFEAFKNAVTAMGGVSVPVTAAEAKEMKRYSKNKISVPSGENVLLGGEEALLYVRIRKQDDDWQRTNRQRTVIKALADKAKSNPIKAFQAAQSVLPEFETDMSGA
ncbi:MAG: LCP family protein, partial [Oscillospiraceae bacterium]|nr:LCP family protein [Oscillospiraceae bacterium]